MGESYWQRKQRHLNEDHEFRRKQSKRTADLIESQERIDRLTDAIETAKAPVERAVSKEFRRLGVEWSLKKTRIVAEIASNRFLTEETKSAWTRVLEAATLTDSDDDNLTGLRFKAMMESFRFDGRLGRSASLTRLVGEVETLIEIRVQARAHL